VLLHDAFAHPYHHLSAFSFEYYLHPEMVESSHMDEVTQLEIGRVPNKRLRDFTCLMFELDEEDDFNPSAQGNAAYNNAVLQRVRDQADQILDVLRLYLFRAGEDRLIGRAGNVGSGVCGMWLCDEETAQFIARRVSPYALAQEPVDVSLDDVRKIYNDEVFRELHSAACRDVSKLDTTLRRVFAGLKVFRESRELQSWEARFRHLATIAESLAKRNEGEHMHGHALRRAIAKIGESQWGNGRANQFSPSDILDVVKDLWDNVRNPITHELTDAASLLRDPKADLFHMEHLVVSMLRAIVLSWRLEEFTGQTAHEMLLA
jgi:hypothetical protein